MVVALVRGTSGWLLVEEGCFFLLPSKKIWAGLEGGNYKAFLVSPMGMGRNLMGVTGLLCLPRGRNS